METKLSQTSRTKSLLMAQQEELKKQYDEEVKVNMMPLCLKTRLLVNNVSGYTVHISLVTTPLSLISGCIFMHINTGENNMKYSCK